MVARSSFAVLVVLVGVAACRGASGPPPPPVHPEPPAAPPPRAADVAPEAGAAAATGDDAAPRVPVALADADCRAFAAAPALGIAVVTRRTPDCSGVGHLRIVLEVRHLVRGANITQIVATRPLVGSDRDALAVGDTLVVAIDPAVHPAATVACVPLPAHEGTLRHALTVASLSDARHLLEQITAGRACPVSGGR